MFHTKLQGQDGERYAESECAGVLTAGNDATLADEGVLTTALAIKTGLVTVSDETNEKSAVFTVHNAGGTVTVTKLNGDAALTKTKDTASSVNLYVEDGVFKVQNLTGAEANVIVKNYA